MTAARSRPALTLAWLLPAALAVAGCRTRTVMLPTAPPADAASDGADAPAVTDSGADGPPCRLGGTATGAPLTVACDQSTPARMALDDRNLYWARQTSGGVIVKAPLAGGAPEVLATDASAAFGIAIDATSVYFTQPIVGRIMRVPIAGGAPAVLAAQQDAPLHLATDGAFLFWTTGRSPGSIMKLPLRDGAVPRTLVGGLPRPRAIAVAGGFVYWTDFADGTVMRVPAADPPDGGAPPLPMQVGYGLLQPADLAVVGGYVYVPDQTGRVMRVAVGGGLMERLAETTGIPFGVASDGVSVYWSVLGDSGGIFKAPVSGAGPPQLLAGGQADPHFLVLDPIAVYWGNWGAGAAIVKMAR